MLLNVASLGQLCLKVDDLLLALGQRCACVTQFRLQACSLVGALLQSGRQQLQRFVLVAQRRKLRRAGGLLGLTDGISASVVAILGLPYIRSTSCRKRRLCLHPQTDDSLKSPP